MLNEMADLSSSFDTGDVVLLMVVCVWGWGGGSVELLCVKLKFC